MVTAPRALPQPLGGSLSLAAFAELFDGLPRVIACAKGTDRTYLYANQLFAERAGQRDVSAVLGKRVDELFPDDLATTYAAQDDEVLRTGHPVQDHLERIGAPGQSARWYVTSKVRLLADSGAVLGVLSASTELAGDPSNANDASAARVAEVISSVKADLGSKHVISELAGRAALTPAQFERIVRRAYGLAPRQLLQRFRFDEAMHLLTHTDLPVADVAVRCGFYDQSSFTRQFRAATGITPAAYRSGHPFQPR